MSTQAPAPGLLAHKVLGQGEPVLLLNGGLMSLSAWEPVAAPLQETFRVVRCDLRGQLLSPGLPPARFEGHVLDVCTLLEALALGPVHVVGVSYGGLVGLLLAAGNPELVRSLTAITTADRVTRETFEASQSLIAACLAAAEQGDGGRVLDLILHDTFSRAYLEAQAEVLATRRRVVAGLPAAWFLGLAGLLRALENLDLRPELGRIRCPTLVLAAERDLTFPLEHSQVLAAAIPGAELVVVPGAPHGLVAEQPQLCLDIVRAFLSRMPVRSTV